MAPLSLAAGEAGWECLRAFEAVEGTKLEFSIVEQLPPVLPFEIEF